MRFPVLRFRWKVMLAMVVVVSVAALAVLGTTQRRVRANYDRMFRTQFERQLQFFVALQEFRIDAVRHRCLDVAASEVVVSALRSSTPDVEALYRTAEMQLKDVLGESRSGHSAPSPSGNFRRGRGGRVGFMRFLDADCSPLMPTAKLRIRNTSGELRQRMAQRMERLHEVLHQGEPQQVGYLALSREFGAAGGPGTEGLSRISTGSDEESVSLQEVIVTRVVDPANGETLGALVLGMPIPDLIPELPGLPDAAALDVERPTLDFQAGILLEGQFYADASLLTPESAEVVAGMMGERTDGATRLEDSFTCRMGSDVCRGYFRLLNPDSSFPPAYEVVLYSMGEMISELNALRFQILLAAAGATLVAFVLSLFLSHGLAVPIHDLVRGTTEIQQGNLNVRVPVRGRDEIGQLAGSFNQMAVGLAQKERYRTILNMVSDEQVAQRLVDGEAQLGGEIRRVSVLFCDIRGFTARTQSMPPEEVVEMLNEHMTALTRVIKRHHGILDKFVGDLLMAVFGAPVSQSNDTLNAVNCALGLIREREQLNATSRFKLQVGIGLATGEVLAGCMGSADRLNYTVLGQRVNLGSRLCDEAGAGEVWIDDATADELREAIDVEALPPMQLHGFSSPVPVYRVKGLADGNSEGGSGDRTG